ncbi:MAG: HNH endonuclease [Gemmatimonadaceae bacterium]|nr:HNH endonuclease [Gemmatimonadaceae bacterium]
MVDHIIPVKEGGTGDDDNLIAACQPCNQGKAAKRLESVAPNPTARKRIRKNRRDLIKAAALAREAEEALHELRQTVVNLWCSVRQTDDIETSTLHVMVRYARDYGVPMLGDWITKAATKFPYERDYKIGKYVSGIRRKMIEQGEIT